VLGLGLATMLVSYSGAKNMTLFRKNKSFAAVNNATISSNITIAAEN